MNWLISTLKSSVGKKIMMSITGLCFCGFLAGHLAGNLTIYGGKEMFNSYAEHLHSLGVLLIFVEWGLLMLATVHILTGLTLFYQNYKVVNLNIILLHSQIFLALLLMGLFLWVYQTLFKYLIEVHCYVNYINKFLQRFLEKKVQRKVYFKLSWLKEYSTTEAMQILIYQFLLLSN